MKLPQGRKMPHVRGFTLIELLVVIAIIGILSSVILASLGTAREKARDATRISDMKNIQKALFLFYDAQQAYPPNGATPSDYFLDPAGGANTPNGDLVTAYLPAMPTDASVRGDTYRYSYIGLDATDLECNDTVAYCPSFFLGATLERADNPVLDTDIDTPASEGPFNSIDTVACADATAAAGEDHCYSLRP